MYDDQDVLMSVVYLAPEWFEALRETTTTWEIPGLNYTAQFNLRGDGRGDDTDYFSECVNGRIIATGIGVHPTPSVYISMRYSDSVAFQQGSADLDELFLAGEITASGDMTALYALTQFRSLPEWLRALKALNDRTVYPTVVPT